MSELPSKPAVEETGAGLVSEAAAGSPASARGSVRGVATRVFSSLRYRDYRLFFIGQFMSTMGTWIQQPVMQWLVWEWTKSPFMLGVLTAVGSLPILLISPLGGLTAERFEKRGILLVTQPLLFIAPVTLAVLLLINPEAKEVWLLFAVAAFSGTIMAFDVPARQSFVVDLVGRADVPNAIALNSFIFNLSRMIGPIVSGALLLWLGSAACFATNGFSYLALVVCLLMMSGRRREMTVGVSERNQKVHYPWGGFFYAWNQKDIRMTMILLASATIFGWSIMSQLPAFTERVFLQERKAFVVFLTAFGAGALVAALAMAYLGSHKNRRRLILTGLIIFLTSVTAFLWSKYVWSDLLGNSAHQAYQLALVPMFFAGLGLLMCMSGVNSHIQMEVSHRFHGRVMGVYAMFFGGMMPLGSILTGYMAENLSRILVRLPGGSLVVDHLPAESSLVLAVQMNIAVLAVVTVWATVYWRRLHRRQAA